MQLIRNYAHNKRYKIDNEGQLKPYSESDKIYLSGTDIYDFYAYYPYDLHAFNPNHFYINVQTDQSIKANYIQNDFMLARNLTGQNTATINLQFHRKFALIETYFEKISGKIVSKAVLHWKLKTVTVNIGDNTITANDISSNFNMLKYDENEYYYTFRAILPVQDIAAQESLFTFTIDDKDVVYKGTTLTPLIEGKKSTYLVDMRYRVYALTENLNGGKVTGAEKEIFKHGERVNLIATPAPDYTFTGFYDHLGDKPILLSNNPVYSFSASKNMRIYGHFIKNDPTYTINATGTQGGSASGGGQYKKNENYTLTATAEIGYTFAGWYENNNTLITNNIAFSLTATSDRSFTARFTPNNNIITVWIDSHLAVTGHGRYFLTGETCTLSTTCYKHYGFGGYFDADSNLITMNPVYSFVVVENRYIITKYVDLTHFFYNHAYWFVHGIESASETTRIKNDHEYQAYTATLKAGEKVRYESVLVWNESPAHGDKHKNTMQITGKTLTIKQNGRIIATTNQPDNYIFTAPTAGNYEFVYTGQCQVIIYAGEKCAGYMHLTAALWKQ
ncbi:MAG: fimbrillin family protein [Odoribacter sp.]